MNQLNREFYFVVGAIIFLAGVLSGAVLWVVLP